MIENFSDFISVVTLVMVVVFMIIGFIRVFTKSRRKRLMEREIEYYKEW